VAYDVELANRIREALGELPSVREVNMFGGLSFVVNEKMALSASNGGDMLLRVDPGRMEDLLGRGAEFAEMGRGRQMSKGWIVVKAEQIESDDEFGFWLEAALEFNRAVTSKAGVRRRGGRS